MISNLDLIQLKFRRLMAHDWNCKSKLFDEHLLEKRASSLKYLDHLFLISYFRMTRRM